MPSGANILKNVRRSKRTRRAAILVRGPRAESAAGSGLQIEPVLDNRLNLPPGIENGEVPPPRPKRIQVAIVSIVGVTGLARIVQSNRVVPVFRVHDDLEGSAGSLVVGAAGRIYGVTIAAARQRSYLELCTLLGLHGVGHRMVDQSVMVSAQLPLLHVRSQSFGEFGYRLIQAPQQEGVAPGDGIGAEPPIRGLHPVDDLGNRRNPDELL